MSQRKPCRLYSCSPPAMGSASASATSPGLLVPVEHHRLLEEAVPVLLQQPADPDRLLHRVEPVGVGVQGHPIAEGPADERDDRLGPARGGDGPDIGGHEHEPADLDLEGAGVVLRDVPPDQLQGLLDRLLAVLRRLVDADLRVMDVADQLAEGLPGDASQEVEDGELDRGERRADGDAVVPEVEAVDEDPLEEQIQVSGVLADEERLQVVDEERVEHLQPAVPHREALGPVARAHPAQEAVSVPQQLEALDDDGRGEQLALQHRLPEDLVQLRVARVRPCRRPDAERPRRERKPAARPRRRREGRPQRSDVEWSSCSRLAPERAGQAATRSGDRTSRRCGRRGRLTAWEAADSLSG